MAAEISSVVFRTQLSTIARAYSRTQGTLRSSNTGLYCRRPLYTCSAKFSQIEVDKQNGAEEKDKKPDKLRSGSEKIILDTTSERGKIPSRWDKQILMYGSRYDTFEDIPERVRLSVLNSTYDRVRVYFMMYTMLMLIILMFTIMYCGRQDVQLNHDIRKEESDGFWEASEKKYAEHKIDRKPKL